MRLVAQARIEAENLDDLAVMRSGTVDLTDGVWIRNRDAVANLDCICVACPAGIAR